MQIITEFTGQFRFLSNFYLSPVHISPYTFPSAEHAFQAMKTLDPAACERIQAVKTPAEAKRLGRLVTKRPDWDAWYRVYAMHTVLSEKFTPSTSLADQLLDTGDAILQEGNNWGDTYWGVCNGKGQNMLGVLLMCVRENLAQA
jgi:ribA/ribD-fused uncharacterized protein